MVRRNPLRFRPPRLSEPQEEYHDADEGLFIDWRKELRDALPDEGDVSQQLAYLVEPKGKFPRDMTKEEIQENWREVRQGKVKEIGGLYELGCFKRWPRNKSHNIIDARWVITWNCLLYTSPSPRD